MAGIGAGLKFNAPMIGAGDYFQTASQLPKGATGYVNNSSGMFAKYNGGGGGSYGFGLHDR